MKHILVFSLSLLLSTPEAAPANPPERLQAFMMDGTLVLPGSADQQAELLTLLKTKPLLDAFSTEIVKLLIQMEDLSEEDLQELEGYYLTALKMNSPETLPYDAVNASTLDNLIYQTSLQRRGRRSRDNWLKEMPEAQFQQLVSEILKQWKENTLLPLTEIRYRFPELLKILLQPDIAATLTADEWETVSRSLGETYTKTPELLTLLDQAAPLPAAFRNQMHILLGGKGRRHPLLGALFQTRYTAPSSEGELLFREMITGGATTKKTWPQHLPSRELSSGERLSLIWAYMIYHNNTRDPFVTEQILKLKHLSDEEVMRVLDICKENYLLLHHFAAVRPLLDEQIRHLTYEGLKSDFELWRMHYIGNITHKGAPDSIPIGYFDQEWLALFEDEDPNMFVIFVHAANMKITPALLWEKFQLHEPDLEDRHASFFTRIPFYVMQEGGPGLREQVFSRMKLNETGPGTPPTTFEEFEATLALDPRTSGNLLPVHATLFYRLFHQEKPRDIVSSLFSYSWTNDIYSHPGEYLAVHRSALKQKLENENRRPVLLPMLATFAMQYDLTESDCDFLREALHRCIRNYSEVNHDLLAGSFAGIMLGLDDPETAAAFADSLALPPLQSYHQYWRITALLNPDHEFLVDELLRVIDLPDCSPYPLQALARISPADPEVSSRIQKVLYEDDAHILACELMKTLAISDQSPALNTFPEERINWFLNFSSKESLHASRKFLKSFPVEDQKILLGKIAERLPEMIAADDGWFTWKCFIDQPGLQKIFAPALFDLLIADDKPSYEYAVRELHPFTEFTPQQIRTLALSITRFEENQNSINLQPRLMRIIGNSGEQAVLAERQIRHYAKQENEWLQAAAIRCLANISNDPAEQEKCLDTLIREFEKEDFWRDRYLKEILRVKGHPETVHAMIDQQVDLFLRDSPESKDSDDVIKTIFWALPELDLSQEKMEELYRSIWEHCAYTQENEDQEIMVTLLWTLGQYHLIDAKAYQDLLPRLPLRHRSQAILLGLMP